MYYYIKNIQYVQRKFTNVGYFVLYLVTKSKNSTNTNI